MKLRVMFETRHFHSDCGIVLQGRNMLPMKTGYAMLSRSGLQVADLIRFMNYWVMTIHPQSYDSQIQTLILVKSMYLTVKIQQET